MKILAFIYSVPPGFIRWVTGKSKFVDVFPLPYYTLLHFVKMDCEVHFVFGTYTQEQLPDRFMGIYLHPYYISKWVKKLPKIRTFFNISIIKAILSVGRKVKPDVIYSMGADSAIPGYIASKKLNLPLVRRVYGNFLYQYTGIRYLPGVLLHTNEFFSFYLPCTQFVITNDGTCGDIMAKKFGIPDNKINFLLNGIPTEFCNLKSSNAIEIKKNWHIPEDAKVIASFCRLEPWKRVDRIIKSMPEIIKKEPKAYLVIASDGSARNELMNLVKGLKLEKSVIFIGRLTHNELLELHSCTDVFISLQDVSNLSSNLLEAISSGRCIVSINDGSLNNLLKGYKDVIVLVDKNKLNKELPDIISNLLMNDNLREYFSGNARKFASENIMTKEERAALELGIINKAVKTF